ncbi:MAG TPA: hypothetical protein VMB25_06170 [Bryobacteraceae bacterium]|nr:hypothetical protein [Bryobacteraceae bacterium]
MDLKVFYQKLKKIEQEITEPHVVVVSEETPDGGRAGQKTEVSRRLAAKLLLEGRARLASPPESEEYHAEVQKAVLEAQQRALADRVQVNVISEADLRAIKSVRPEKR